MKKNGLTGVRLAMFTALGLLLGCGGSSDSGSGGQSAPPPPPPPPPPASAGYQLGSGDHTPASVTFTVIANSGNALKKPRDLAFNPRVPEDLWIVNATDDSVVIVHNTTLASRTTEWRKDSWAGHFMDNPAALAFGADATTFGLPGTWATAGETTNGTSNYTGPTLWSSDLTVFAVQNGGLGSHLDMLHDSPNSMGIAWQVDNVYWVFGGMKSDIVRYDFQLDHGIGQDDHSDGRIRHYLGGQVARVPGVPGHLFFHTATNMLYIADTGNGRVIRLDTTSGAVSATHSGPDGLPEDFFMTGEVTSVVVAAGTFLTQPCGLEIKDDVMFVSDNATGIIHAFDLLGNRVNHIDTGLGPGAVMGLAFGPDGKLYFVNATGNQVIRLDP